MSELDFTRAEYNRAEQSFDEAELAALSMHTSRYIRTRVAGNPNTPREVRDKLRESTSSQTGILLWLLGNLSCTREEFTAIYMAYIGRSYEGNVHIALASSHHATTRELCDLLRINHWCVTMAVLNNYKSRDFDEYRKIIKPYLPDEETSWEKWKEEEKLAYFRTTGNRRPNRP